jgi:hypothetical protein
VTVPIEELVRDVLRTLPRFCDEATELYQRCIVERAIKQHARLDVSAHRRLREIWAPDHAAYALPVTKQVELRVEQVARGRNDGCGR